MPCGTREPVGEVEARRRSWGEVREIIVLPILSLERRYLRRVPLWRVRTEGLAGGVASGRRGLSGGVSGRRRGLSGGICCGPVGARARAPNARRGGILPQRLIRGWGENRGARRGEFSSSYRRGSAARSGQSRSACCSIARSRGCPRPSAGLQPCASHLARVAWEPACPPDGRTRQGPSTAPPAEKQTTGGAGRAPSPARQKAAKPDSWANRRLRRAVVPSGPRQPSPERRPPC